MPNHLSAIGFDINCECDFNSLAHQVSNTTKLIKTCYGSYLQWQGQYGEQLWLQFDRKGNFIGMNPHYAGAGRSKVELLTRVKRPGYSSLDGGFQAWVDKNKRLPNGSDISFVFDVPDAALYFDMELPARAIVQITAFAHTVKHQPRNNGNPVANRHFHLKAQTQLPLLGQPAYFGESMAHIHGQVKQFRQQINCISGLPYYWVLISACDGEYDLMIDANLLQYPLQIGDWISGSFWLSGQIVQFENGRCTWLETKLQQFQ